MRKLDNSFDSVNPKAVIDLNLGLEIFICMIFQDLYFCEMVIVRKYGIATRVLF